MTSLLKQNLHRKRCKLSQSLQMMSDFSKGCAEVNSVIGSAGSCGRFNNEAMILSWKKNLLSFAFTKI